MSRYRIDLDDCVNLIMDTNIREFVQKLLDEAPPQFWKDPSSSSKKYHPPENNAVGGIVVHTRKTVQTALCLIRLFDGYGGVDRDEILAACILHDLYKHGMPWADKTDYCHGPIAADIISKKYFELYNKKNPRIERLCYLIACHMGKFNRPEPYHIREHKNDYGALIVIVSDYISAMRPIQWVANEIMDM